MHIIFSPAKGFKKTDIKSKDIPKLYKKSEKIVELIKEMNIEDIKKNMKISDNLAELNYKRYRDFSFTENNYPALFTFDGMAYKALSVETLSPSAISYLEKRLYILSGLYGILRPYDAISPYRLDLNDKIMVDGQSLKAYFGDTAYKVLAEECDTIINLASKEYSDLIIPHIKNERLINISFKTYKNGKYKIMSTDSKKGRAMLLRSMAENNIENIEDIKDIKAGEFRFFEEKSYDNKKIIDYIFVS